LLKNERPKNLSILRNKIFSEVARLTPQGIGVKFKMVNQDQEAMIKSLLEWLSSTRR